MNERPWRFDILMGIERRPRWFNVGELPVAGPVRVEVSTLFASTARKQSFS